LKSSTTGISEPTAIVRARKFVRDCGINSIPVDLEKFVTAANAEIRKSSRLGAGAAGNTMYVGGKHLIFVNGSDSLERQRFTVLHEIAHIVLELPSKHEASSDADAMFNYARRPPEEIICDTFAAECLLPHEFLRQDLKDAVAGFAFVDGIAQRYEASLSCTASRIVVNAPYACAYVLSQDGYVRFATYSQSMREARFWISGGIAVPVSSVTGQCLKSGKGGHSGIVPAHLWTTADAFADVDLAEEVRALKTWKQAITLLWLDADDSDIADTSRHVIDRDDGEPLLKELDGVLPWPGRKKRKS
jgi:Zn-dependent peptidase ImmA (M78 family)